LGKFIHKWEELEPKAIQVFLRDFELTLTFYQFDENLHRHIRRINHLERLFREFRAKSDEIGAFPYETSCLTVFFSLLNMIMLNMTARLWRKIRDTDKFQSRSSFARNCEEQIMGSDLFILKFTD